MSMTFCANALKQTRYSTTLRAPQISIPTGNLGMFALPDWTIEEETVRGPSAFSVVLLGT